MQEVELSRVKSQDLPRVTTSKVLPSINRVLQTGDYVGLNPHRLITKFNATGCSIKELQERERKESPIEKLYPYSQELLSLGVKRTTIEQAFDRVSNNFPYIRKVFELPEQIDISKNLFLDLDNPIIRTAYLLISIDMLGAPEIKKINDNGMKESARRTVEKNAIEVTLKKIIQNSGENFENPKFNDVKDKIARDLASSKTTYYLMGAQVGAALDGQSLDESSLYLGTTLNTEIAHSLAFPALKLVIADLKINPLQANSIFSDTKRRIEPYAEHIKEATRIDLSDKAQNEDKSMNYRILLDLYLNSQIPYLTMMDNVDIE